MNEETVSRNKQEIYLEVLKEYAQWITILDWAKLVSEKYPDLLKEAEEQALKQTTHTTGIAQLKARIGSLITRNAYPDVEIDDSKGIRQVRYMSEDTKNEKQEENQMETNNTKLFYDNYSNNGFSFPESVLTTYCLSLKTKPFVLLSGISGTGKTKIAQLFKTPDLNIEVQDEAVEYDLQLKLPNDFESGSIRSNFKIPELDILLTPDELISYNEQRTEALENGHGGNFTGTIPYMITIEDQYGEFNIAFYAQRASSPLIRIRFEKSNRMEGPEFDARPHLRAHYSHGDHLSLEKIADKKFRVIALNDETAVINQQAWDDQGLEKTCFISVKSDWTDNSELFGHYNLIEKKYHLTKLLKFILKAKEYPEFSFFLLLDEMNLSKVEHYFSDFLSCIESRYHDGDKIVQEKINLYSSSYQLDTDDDDYEVIPSSIEIPTNLYVTGTVNIDESTYMFSPKVIDRANIIEFNEVNLNKYGAESEEVVPEEGYKLSSFPDFSDLKLATQEDYKQLDTIAKNEIKAVHDILKKYHLHFGYRTTNEISLYIKNAKQHIDTNSHVIYKALDFQFVQKVFPKLNGGFSKLESPLNELIKYFEDESRLSNFPITLKKLKRVRQNLQQSGFASFIE